MEAISNIPPAHILLVYLFPVILFGIAISSFASTPNTAEMMGFHSVQKDKTKDLFVYAFGVRELAFAVCVSLLIAQGQWKALTIVMACCGINGTGDFLLDGLHGQGWLHALHKHGIPTIVGYWVVWRLYQDW